jgi:hypothetical protein
MNLKMMKAAFAGTILAISGFANAGIIDHGGYTEVNGIDWLDWTTTLGMTESAALGVNVGWRGATEAEMELLMNAMFPTTFVFDANGINNTDVGNAYPTEMSRFLELFGATDNGNTYATAVGSGLVGFDSSAYAGLYSDTSPREQVYASVGYSANWNGVALVRSADVPEPSTLAIFALGMIGLASRRFKKQA